MSPRKYRGRAAGRFCLGLAAVGCVFADVAAANAQAPVITNPGDLRNLSVNTVFRPRDPDPGWKSWRRCPPPARLSRRLLLMGKFTPLEEQF